MNDEMLTLQRACRWDGFANEAETERVARWALLQMERLREAEEALRRIGMDESPDYRGTALNHLSKWGAG